MKPNETKTAPIAPVTNAHIALARDIMLDHTPARSAETIGVRNAAQLIADSEARATAELRGALALGQQNCDDVFEDLRDERDQLRAEVERLTKQIKDDNRSYGCELRDPNGTIWEQATKDHARAERAEAMLGKLQELHGCSQEMVVHWCEHAAKRSLELDFQMARNSDLFTQRDEAVEAREKAEAELAAERARSKQYRECWCNQCGKIITTMKEGAK